MSWTYQGNLVEELPEDCVGFVYLITNTVTGRKYVGKNWPSLPRPHTRP